MDYHLDRILRARGAFIAGVGELEIGLTEVAIRISRVPEYHALRSKFPKRRNDRIGFLRGACEISSSLSRFAPTLTKFVDRFENYSAYRDLLAHARMRALSGPGDEATIDFDDYYAAPEGVHYRLEKATLSELEKKAKRACRTARAFNCLYAQITEQLPRIKSIEHLLAPPT